MSPHARHEGRPERANWPTFASLIEQINADQALAPRRRQDLASALRTVAKALGKSPEDLPANPASLRQRLVRFTPAMAGVSRRRWQNALSLVRAAFKHAGLTQVPGRSRTPLSAAWAELFRHISNPKTRYGLSRFARYCSERGIAPEAVDDAVLEAFRNDLVERAVVNHPDEIHRNTCVLWNKARRTIPVWPPQCLSVHDRRRFFALPWAAFPDSLKLDVDAYLERLAGKDLLAGGNFRPLRPISIANRLKMLRAFASALVHRGRNPQHLCALYDLIAIEAVTDGLRFYLARSDNKVTAQIHEIAHVLTAVARHWVEVGEEHLKKLEDICDSLRRPERGIMSAKTRHRLRPFADPAVVQALLTVSDRILLEAKRKRQIPRAAALEVQTALAIELLLMVPIRIGNLARIDIERQLIRHRGGTMQLAINGAETKNGIAVEAVLPAHLVSMIDSYLADHRPLLAGESSSWLFPGRGGRPLGAQALGKRISKALKCHAGLDVNPHLFRAIAGKLYLDRNPGAYGLLRLVLGHRSVDTTTRYYCGTETTSALRQFDDTILRMRATLPSADIGGRTR